MNNTNFRIIKNSDGTYKIQQKFSLFWKDHEVEIETKNVVTYENYEDAKVKMDTLKVLPEIGLSNKPTEEELEKELSILIFDSIIKAYENGKEFGSWKDNGGWGIPPNEEKYNISNYNIIENLTRSVNESFEKRLSIYKNHLNNIFNKLGLDDSK